MSRVTYMATPVNLMRYSDGTLAGEWVEVVVVAKRRHDQSGLWWYIVKTLDGAKTFTTSEEYLFEKVSGIDEEVSNENHA